MPAIKYAIGRIRALEARILDENKLIRMCNAQDFQQAFHILNETDYAELFNKTLSPFDFDTMLDLARLEIKKFCETVLPKNPIISAFWAKYDYENIKILIVAKLNKKEPPRLFQCGNINTKNLEGYIFKDLNLVGRYTKELISKATKTHAESNDILAVFDQIDLAYLKLLGKTTKKSGSALFIKWAEYYADLYQLKRMLREKKETGKIESAFSAKDFYPCIQPELTNTQMYKIEKEIDRFLIDHIKRAKYLCSGIEPILVFLFAKEIEILNISLILECKKNHVPPEKIKERIRYNV
ncbi:MAG: V-type ATPase subunit [Candidatus Saganbacteria bacterium]|nr:V-type ATPase subunit [Candidatus Saganbacteria bacterium]